MENFENRCTNCGVTNPENVNYCGHCGHKILDSAINQIENDNLPELDEQLTPSIIGGPRILALTFATWGLYFYYWIYITWKDLQSEISDSHTPALQTISMFIPIYQLFRFNRHIVTIRNISLEAGLRTELNPILGVLLVALNGVIGYISLWIESLPVFAGLLLLSLILTAAVINWVQETLNRYWVVVKSVDGVEKRMGTGEWVLCGLGIFVWVNLLTAI